MVRKRSRKTAIGTVSEDVMKAAAESVVTREKSLTSASTDFGIPKTTLFRYVIKLKKASSGEKINMKFCPNYSVRRVFSDEEEAMLANYITNASTLHYGLSPSCRILYNVAGLLYSCSICCTISQQIQMLWICCRLVVQLSICCRFVVDFVVQLVVQQNPQLIEHVEFGLQLIADEPSRPSCCTQTWTLKCDKMATVS